ncbi:MAG: hypothetical protein M3N68_00215 [Actinomycetota bacterium]|nr:hypothetical protein [Actinomycetota bacterium]
MAARIAVGVVLLWAGAAKLFQPAWPETAAAFGAPRGVVRVLPVLEVSLGALLVAGVGLPWTAVAALVLLAGFTAAVAARLVRGQRVPCGCFGETSGAPVGRDTLIRNLVLCWLAAMAVRGGDGGVWPVLLGVGGGLLFVGESRARAGAGRRQRRSGRSAGS